MNIHDIMLGGTDQDLDRAMNAPHALVVDRGSEEPEVLAEVARLLPGFAFPHQFDSEGTCHVELRYRDRAARKAYTNTPYNCFRIILDVEALVGPDASLRVYEPTMASTTHAFAVGDESFWQRFDSEAATARRQMFQPVSFLDAAWELSGPDGGADNDGKKWWQFWK